MRSSINGLGRKNISSPRWIAVVVVAIGVALGIGLYEMRSGERPGMRIGERSALYADVGGEPPTSCTGGVDCFCDVNTQYEGCWDFDSLSEYNSIPLRNPFHGYPSHGYHSYEANNGFYSVAAGSVDTGAIKMTLTGVMSDQSFNEIWAFSGGGPSTGVIAIGYLIKGGPTFWSRYAMLDGKWMIIEGLGGTGSGNNWTAFNKSVNGGPCTTPYTAMMVPTTLGQGVGRVDEAGCETPDNCACQHAVPLSDDKAGLWIWLEFRYNNSDGVGTIYMKDENNNNVTFSYDTGSPVERTGGATLHYFNVNGTSLTPDAGSYAYVDLIIKNDGAIGAPF